MWRLVETLDYKSPRTPRWSVWQWLYAIFVPAVGICYGIACVWLCRVEDRYEDLPTAPPRAVVICAYVLGFPMLDFPYNDLNFFSFLGLAFCNAVIWGFAVVGFFHAMSLIRAKLSGGH